MVEIKVGMKAILANCKRHKDYNFQICEIKEIENSKKIYVELHNDEFITNFYVEANEIIPIMYENPEDLKKCGTTIDDIAKLFSEYKGYYDLICSVADDLSHELEEKDRKYNQQINENNCQIEEMQHHIDCLEADKNELRSRCKGSARDNFDNHLYGLLNIVGAEELCKKQELPPEPIKVAEMLIYANYSYKDKIDGMLHRGRLYSKSDLRQIAEHLLVYCNNTEDGD